MFTESLYMERAFQGFHYDEILFQRQTEYQAISIYQTRPYGRVLVLDGVVQTTEADEFIYHESLVHVPLMSLETPQRVMIVGGGDGGTLREVLKHPIEHVDMVEIDQGVIDCSREYLPTLNDNGRAFDDPRTTLVIEDAFAFLKRHRGEYDAIIIDSTDPVGAAEALFSDEFYRLCCESLSPQGVISAQDGVVFFQPGEISLTVSALRALGLHAGAYINAVPTYVGGVMAFGVAGRCDDVLQPQRDVLDRRYARVTGKMRHYSPAVHVASFVLPGWVDAAVRGEVT